MHKKIVGEHFAMYKREVSKNLKSVFSFEKLLLDHGEMHLLCGSQRRRYDVG